MPAYFSGQCLLACKLQRLHISHVGGQQQSAIGLERLTSHAAYIHAEAVTCGMHVPKGYFMRSAYTCTSRPNITPKTMNQIMGKRKGLSTSSRCHGGRNEWSVRQLSPAPPRPTPSNAWLCGRSGSLHAGPKHLCGPALPHPS